MSLTLSLTLLQATSSSVFKMHTRHMGHDDWDREVLIDTAMLGDEGIEELLQAAQSVDDAKAARALRAIKQAREGMFSHPVPSFKAFKGVLEAFLAHGIIDGWIYVTGPDGQLYPELVTAIEYSDGRRAYGKPRPSVTIITMAYGDTDSDRERLVQVHLNRHDFEPHDVVNKRIGDILADVGIFKETQDLRQAHDRSMDRYRNSVMSEFSKQFRVTGRVRFFEKDDYARRGQSLEARRVIHDLPVSELGPVKFHTESVLFKEPSDGDVSAAGVIPQYPVVRVFDLRAHEFFWVHSDFLEPYEYDHSLRDKLVLPATHRDLLDVLTTDLSAFTSDIIEDKSAGNVILCKGVPGVGKTLTAEVYAELTNTPLYVIRCGELGTTAKDIEGSLQAVFQRSKRWGCVLLLDEADVFVARRGDNIQQNAIVAEFLRALEYFDGLLFMTTNRPDDIDDAIISRCIAVIDYVVPQAADAAAIWRVMADQFRVSLGEGLVSQLVLMFPEIAPRDIKMLLRLALRVAAADGGALSPELFRRCAMFRAIKMGPHLGAC